MTLQGAALLVIDVQRAIDARQHTADVTITFNADDPKKQMGRRSGRGGGQ